MAALWEQFFSSRHDLCWKRPASAAIRLFLWRDAYLLDGRLLSAGGTDGYNPFRGRKDSIIFDPSTQQWSFVASMAHGRWHPSLVSLSDGRLLAATGLTGGFR